MQDRLEKVEFSASWKGKEHGNSSSWESSFLTEQYLSHMYQVTCVTCYSHTLGRIQPKSPGLWQFRTLWKDTLPETIHCLKWLAYHILPWSFSLLLWISVSKLIHPALRTGGRVHACPHHSIQTPQLNLRAVRPESCNIAEVVKCWSFILQRYFKNARQAAVYVLQWQESNYLMLKLCFCHNLAQALCWDMILQQSSSRYSRQLNQCWQQHIPSLGIAAPLRNQCIALPD